jgi:anthranilate synthase/aminodeoxychorismate synthase-like glutamine amidotransferase
MLLVIDNYDSFTYNLVQYFQEIGQTVLVRRNDRVTLEEIIDMNPSAIIISPGPGGPQDAGISMEVIRDLGDRIPIFGVCLGHQAIGAVFGAQVVAADRLMHGKTSRVTANGSALFSGISSPFEACRYHSLIVDWDTLPDCLQVTAWTDDGEIMGIRHKERPIEGVQFHPESILTPAGKHILENFLDMTARFHSNPACKTEPADHQIEHNNLGR